MKTWSACFAVLCALFLAFNLAYHFGGDGVRISGADMSFSRGADVQLFTLSESLAVLVSRSDAEHGSDELAVVETAGAPFPLSVICGERLPDGFALDHDAAVQAGRAVSAVVRTEPHPIEGQKDRVLIAMTPAHAVERLEPLSTCNESCVTFNAAFLFLGAVGLIALPFVWRRSRRSANAG